MDLQITDQPAPQVQADALIVGIYHDSLTDAAQQLDLASGGVIRRVLELGEFKPDIGKSLTLYCLDNVATPVVVLIGLGEKSAFTRSHAFRAMATASRQVCDRQREHLVYCGDSHWSDSIAADGVAGAIVGMAGPDLHQTKRRRFAPGRTSWSGIPAAAVGRGRTLGESINLTRRLVNEPPNLLYPESFAEAASQVAANLGLSLEVWDQQRLEAERCGALLAVAQGSARSPRVVILQHGGASREDAPWLALVGKGVTFDSGGLSLKPSDSMKTMKCDMAGAATVLGAMQAIAKLKLPVNVMGLMGLVENLPSATAFKLGDVITARSGTTIEIHNTDAEGRLVLADLLDVAVERGADRIVDLATLTGACVVALGTDVAGAMTNHQSWCDTVKIGRAHV